MQELKYRKHIPVHQLAGSFQELRNGPIYYQVIAHKTLLKLRTKSVYGTCTAIVSSPKPPLPCEPAVCPSP